MGYTAWRVADVFLQFDDHDLLGAANRDLQNRTFMLIVAEALDYREPMSSITDDVSRAYWTSNLLAVVRAVERHHGIGESR